MHVLLTGGGSGGHIFPLIAVARKLRKIGEERGEKVHLYYMGPATFGRDILELENIKVANVSTAKWRRYASAENITDIYKIPIGLAQALWKMFWIMPDVIFSKGGHGSLPAVWASHVYRIPLMIHESDSVPGVANRYAGKFAKRIFTSFEKAGNFFPKDKVILLGNPTREELFTAGPEEGRGILNIKFSKPVLYITGGSRGAEKINDVVVNTLPQLLEHYEVIHQCGKENVDDIRELTTKEYKAELLQSYHLFGLMKEDETRAAYAASDLVISRASSSIFEISRAAKPSIVIPLSGAANNHQFENANAYAACGACVVLDEQNMTQNLFTETIAGIIGNREKMLTMADAARNFAKPDAAENIAQEIFDFAERR